MSRLRCLCAAVLVAGLTLAAWAQQPPPAAPVLPTPPPPPPMAPPSPFPVGINDYPPPPGPPTMWSYMGVDAQQREYRQLRQARTPFGEFREKLQNPLSKLTGGLIKPFPPLAATQALLKDPGPIGAAAKIKLDKAAAPDRVKAIGELATVDCYYWPEAEEALIGALRVDRNMSVRLAAAQALGTGCCCTKKTIAALGIAASSSDADGNPAEKCPEVVAAAHTSLMSCLARVCACVPAETVPTDPMDPRRDPTVPVTPMAGWSKPGPAGYEKPSGGMAAARLTAKEYYDRIALKRWAELIPPAQAIASRTPQVPAYLLLSGPGLDAGEVATDLRGRPREPETLLDLLLGTPAPTEARSASTGSSWGMSNLYDQFFRTEPPAAYTSILNDAPQVASVQPRPLPAPAAAQPTPRHTAATSWAPSPANAPQPTAPALFTQPAVMPTPAKAEPAKPAAPTIIPAVAVAPAPAPVQVRLMGDNPLPPLVLPKPALPMR